MTTIRVKGLKQLQRKLDRMSRDFRPEMKQATLKAVLHVHSQIPPYPPPPSGSTYRRTGTLGRTVTTLAGRHPDALSRVEALGAAVRGFVGTRLRYARWVIDRRRQAFMHKGRWWTLQDVVEGERKEIVKIYQRMLKDLIKRRR